MTTTRKVRKECGVCGRSNQCTEIMSTRTSGSDLDTRPRGIARFTIDVWVQTCRWCGYCAPDVSEPTEGAKEVVQSQRYRAQKSDPRFPKLATYFLCSSLIKESAGDYAGAAWEAINAAWVCDEPESTGMWVSGRRVRASETSAEGSFSRADLAQKASECRTRAVTLLEKAREGGQRFAEQAGGEEALIADLLRRSGQFGMALKACEDGLKQKPDSILSDVLGFEMALIGKSDVGCHTVAEATGGDG